MTALATRRGLGPPLRLLAVALLAAGALPATAATSLDLFLGPHDTRAIAARSLRVLLDGAPLPVSLPPAGADPGTPVYSGPVGTGPHRVELELVVAGDTPVFAYTHDYLFTLRGRLDVQAAAGEVVAVQARVTHDDGFLVHWIDRNRLELRATHYRSPPDGAPEAAVAAALPVAAPSSPPPPRPAPAACALPTVHFAFDRATLDAAALAAIDGFARCLGGTDATVRLQGHADPQGPAAYNMGLSERRARAVAAALVERGVARDRLRVEAFGETRLACTAPDPACNARNRRVEAVVGG